MSVLNKPCVCTNYFWGFPLFPSFHVQEENRYILPLPQSPSWHRCAGIYRKATTHLCIKGRALPPKVLSLDQLHCNNVPFQSHTKNGSCNADRVMQCPLHYSYTFGMRWEEDEEGENEEDGRRMRVWRERGLVG